jgi:hypothetical protein
MHAIGTTQLPVEEGKFKLKTPDRVTAILLRPGLISFASFTIW